MKQHNAGSRGITTVDIVESHTIAVGKATNGRVIPFRQHRKGKVPDHQKNEGDYNNDGDGLSSGHSLNLVARRYSNSSAGLPHLKEPVCPTTGSSNGCSSNQQGPLTWRPGTNL